MASAARKKARSVHRPGARPNYTVVVKNDFFYYPLVAWQFFSGMRPSETFALTWRDVHLEGKTVSINKSRDMGVTAVTKTANSERIIPLDGRLIEILKL